MGWQTLVSMVLSRCFLRGFSSFHMFAFTDIQTLAIVGLAFALGGILKGATGVGAPLVAVPLMTSFFDVRFAVAVFVLPNLITNLLQGLTYYYALKNGRFLLTLCLSAGTGAFVGSLILLQTSSGILEKIMASLVLFYVGFRVFKPGWKLSIATAFKLSAPIGFLAGFLQGTFGISSPATFTFLNAIKFERPEFIVIVSMFFVAMSIIQLPTLIYFDLMHAEHFYLGMLAIIPLIGGMPLGAMLLRNVSAILFDKIILLVLVVIAIKLLLV